MIEYSALPRWRRSKNQSRCWAKDRGAGVVPVRRGMSRERIAGFFLTLRSRSARLAGDKAAILWLRPAVPVLSPACVSRPFSPWFRPRSSSGDRISAVLDLQVVGGSFFRERFQLDQQPFRFLTVLGFRQFIPQQ